MTRRTTRTFMYAAVMVLLISFTSCGKYEDGPGFSLASKTSRLTGVWDVVKTDAEFDLSEGDLSFEFEKEGDFTLRYNSGNYSDKDEGDWEWSSDKEVIEVTNSNDVTEDWEVLRLTNSEFWFEDENKDVWECEKD